MEPVKRHLLIVKPAIGLKIWDTPRPQSQGAILRRAEPKGAQLYASRIISFAGVPYALLIPRDPTKPEWVRVSEAGSAVPEYCEVYDLEVETDQASGVAKQLGRIADAIEKLARNA